jgi:hypothetical protein
MAGWPPEQPSSGPPAPLSSFPPLSFHLHLNGLPLSCCRSRRSPRGCRARAGHGFHGPCVAAHGSNSSLLHRPIGPAWSRPGCRYCRACSRAGRGRGGRGVRWRGCGSSTPLLQAPRPCFSARVHNSCATLADLTPQFPLFPLNSPIFPSSRLDLLVEARADHVGMAAHAAALPLAAAAAAPHAGVRAAGAFSSTAALALAAPSFSGAGVATAATTVLIENQTAYAHSLLMCVLPLTVPSLPAVLTASPAIGADGHTAGLEALFAPPAETAASLPSHAAAGSSAYGAAPSGSAPRQQKLRSQLQLKPCVRALHVEGWIRRTREGVLNGSR